MSDPNQTQGSPSAAPQSQIDQYQLDMLVQQRRDNQNLGLGIVGGVIGALVGAALWALITSLTNFQIGFMAVGVGLLAGYGVRKLGQGIDAKFGIVGALLALAGCLAGNLFVICYLWSAQSGLPFFEVLSSITPSLYAELLKESFSPIDLIFYGIAVYEGYKFSIAPVTLGPGTR
jgi:hypothetical protein